MKRTRRAFAPLWWPVPSCAGGGGAGGGSALDGNPTLGSWARGWPMSAAPLASAESRVEAPSDVAGGVTGGGATLGTSGTYCGARGRVGGAAAVEAVEARGSSAAAELGRSEADCALQCCAS